MRIGQSIDIHRLAPGRKMIVGGIEIPSEIGSVGHSDGDALTHAITEAIIGALGKGDIGKFFPDTDPKYKDIYSIKLLEQVVELMEKEGYHIINVDSLVMIEKPHLSKYIDEIRDKLANSLKVDRGLVNVKATRGEGLGFIGNSEGYQASAVVLIDNNEN